MRLIRDKVGRPLLEEDQPELLRAIADLAAHGGVADRRRQSDLVRCRYTLKRLHEELQNSGFILLQSATYLRLVPRNSSTTEGKRHHVQSVPVKLCRAQADERKSHPDGKFCTASIRSVEEVVAILGPEQCFVLSQDDKARVPIGITAANKQAPVLMHMTYCVRLPDHDFVVAPSHKLIPSVYAGIVLQDAAWVAKLAFLADVTGHLNELNKKLQGKGSLASDMFREVGAFEGRLDLFEAQLHASKMTHFPCLSSLGEIDPDQLHSFVNIVNLKREFRKNFVEFHAMASDFEVFVTPFSASIASAPDNLQLNLIDLRSDRLLREKFNSVSLQEFYGTYITSHRFPHLHKFASKMIAMFGSTYICEQFFSLMNYVKNKYRSKLTDKNLTAQLRVMARNNIQPNFDELVLGKRAQVSPSNAKSLDTHARRLAHKMPQKKSNKPKRKVLASREEEFLCLQDFPEPVVEWVELDDGDEFEMVNPPLEEPTIEVIEDIGLWTESPWVDDILGSINK
ncbi:hypothetical protein FOCC_FOCC010940 [Frankliniella occidentalis]|nr:hypothetical protein FOCC_FOCC010940 [Frankliniella occidentalis]